MVHQVGQDFLQLEEEAFAGGITVREHVEKPPPDLLPSVAFAPQLLRYQRAIARGGGDPTLQISKRGTMWYLQPACPEPPQSGRRALHS